MSKIIALVDGSVYSESVCDYAAWVATRRALPVELLHVLGRREGGRSNLSGSIGLGARSKLMEELAELDTQTAKLALRRGRAILEDAEKRLRADGVGEVSSRLRHGDLIEELGEAETGAELVVVGKRGEAADFARLHLGSNLERAVRASTKPVLVTARAFRPVEHFLIAFDGGASTQLAVGHVARSKEFAGLKCTLLMAGEDVAENRRKLEGAAAELKAAGYEVSVELKPGRADVVITEAVMAGGSDMLLMGAFGHSRIRSLIIGSTTAVMVRDCHVPVLLFR